MPDVRGKTIPEARELLRNAGFRFLIRLHPDSSRTAGVVETQTLDESTRRVDLVAVATSTVLVRNAPGDEQKANDLVAYLKEQPSTIGSIVRAESVTARAEIAGRVGYSEDRLAAQAEAIAKDASEFLARTGRPQGLKVAVRPRVGSREIIIGLENPSK